MKTHWPIERSVAQEGGWVLGLCLVAYSGGLRADPTAKYCRRDLTGLEARTSALDASTAFGMR